MEWWTIVLYRKRYIFLLSYIRFYSYQWNRCSLHCLCQQRFLVFCLRLNVHTFLFVDVFCRVCLITSARFRKFEIFNNINIGPFFCYFVILGANFIFHLLVWNKIANFQVWGVSYEVDYIALTFYSLFYAFLRSFLRISGNTCSSLNLITNLLNAVLLQDWSILLPFNIQHKIACDRSHENSAIRKVILFILECLSHAQWHVNSFEVIYATVTNSSWR